jgi:nucleoside-diphosphate-sugar epimerase
MDALKSLAGRRVFVTGGTGTLGREFVALAKLAGAIVHAPSRSSGFDLRDGPGIAAEVAGFRPEYLYHFAAAGVSQAAGEDDLKAINVEALGSLLAAAAALPVPAKCLLIGTCAEYASSDGLLSEVSPLGPRNAYARSKQAAAELAQGYADRLPILWLRMFNVYGAGEKLPRLLPYLVECARQGVPADVTAGAQLLDYTSAEDAASIFIRLGLTLKSEPSWKVINVGSGRPVTALQFMQAACEALRRRGLDLRLRLGARPYRKEDAMSCLPDVSLLRAAIGALDVRPLDAGLAEVVEQMLDHPPSGG